MTVLINAFGFRVEVSQCIDCGSPQFGPTFDGADDSLMSNDFDPYFCMLRQDIDRLGMLFELPVEVDEEPTFKLVPIFEPKHAYPFLRLGRKEKLTRRRLPLPRGLYGVE